MNLVGQLLKPSRGLPLLLLAASLGASPPSGSKVNSTTPESTKRQTATDLINTIFGPHYKAKYSYLETIKLYEDFINSALIVNNQIELETKKELLALAKDLLTIDNKKPDAPEEYQTALEKYKYEFMKAFSKVMDAKNLNLDPTAKNKLLNDANITLLQLHKAASIIFTTGPILAKHENSWRPRVRDQAKSLTKATVLLIEAHREQLNNPELAAAWKAKNHDIEIDLNIMHKIAIIEETIREDIKQLEKYATIDEARLKAYEIAGIETMHSYDKGEHKAKTIDKLKVFFEARKRLFIAAQATNPEASGKLQEYISKEQILTVTPEQLDALK